MLLLQGCDSSGKKQREGGAEVLLEVRPMRNALGTGEGTTVDNEDGTYTIKYRVSDKGNYEVR